MTLINGKSKSLPYLRSTIKVSTFLPLFVTILPCLANQLTELLSIKQEQEKAEREAAAAKIAAEKERAQEAVARKKKEAAAEEERKAVEGPLKDGSESEVAKKLGQTVEHSGGEENPVKLEADEMMMGIPPVAAMGMGQYVNYMGD